MPTITPTVTLVLTEENKRYAEAVISRAITVGERGTEGDGTIAGLCYLFLAAAGAYGYQAQRQALDEIGYDDD